MGYILRDEIIIRRPIVFYVDHIVKKQIKVTEGISCESALKIILKMACYLLL